MFTLPTSLFRSALFWFVSLATLALISLWARSFFPVDETRYVSVAWEMWQRGDLLVPFKNGEPYSHKPPLLFWMIHGGWWLFGVSDWWPRLISPLLSLVSLGMTWRLARRLWPREPEVAPLATSVLLSSGLWMAFGQALMFDILVAACALLGLVALVELVQGGRRRWWGVFALSVGVGILAKGPAILVHLLPVALVAPWWASAPLNRRSWYLGVVISLVIGIMLALLWAIPAGYAGGEVYRNAIFWGQTANRMVDSFAHRRAFWWYLPILPLLLAPWLLWPQLWRSLWLMLRSGMDSGMRMVVLWFGAAFLIFSLISGKQVHYLLPELPAAALLIGLALRRGPDLGRPIVPALALLTVSMIVVVVPQMVKLPTDHNFVSGGLGLLALGLVMLFIRGDIMQRVWGVTLTMLAAFGWMLMTVVLPLSPHYDLRPMARELARYQGQGYAIGYHGFYHAQFNFLGRLTRPVEELHNEDTAAWAEQNPKGLVVVAVSKDEESASLHPLFSQPYRSRTLLLVDRQGIAELQKLRAESSSDEDAHPE